MTKELLPGVVASMLQLNGDASDFTRLFSVMLFVRILW